MCADIFAVHPHGILSFSAWLAFATEALGFSKLFPGIDCRVLTLVSSRAFLARPVNAWQIILYSLPCRHRRTAEHQLQGTLLSRVFAAAR